MIVNEILMRKLFAEFWRYRDKEISWEQVQAMVCDSTPDLVKCVICEMDKGVILDSKTICRICENHEAKMEKLREDLRGR